MPPRISCRPGARQCEKLWASDELIRDLGACGVRFSGTLAHKSLEAFGCCLPGAIMEEFKRQTILEYDLPPLGYDEALAFTLSILQGEVTPAQAFESLDPRQTSRNLE